VQLGDTWRFHDALWPKGLRVMVMPRTLGCEVVDSNTGIVLGTQSGSPFNPGDVVTNDGQESNCDKAALDYMLTGKRSDGFKAATHGVIA
jgi:hypothetical protein